MLFEAKSYYKRYKDYSSHERDYNFNLWSNRLFNSMQVECLFETNEFVFLHRDDEPDYNSQAYKDLQKELIAKKMYIVYIGNFILSVEEKVFNDIKKELSKVNNSISLDIIK